MTLTSTSRLILLRLRRSRVLHRLVIFRRFVGSWSKRTSETLWERPSARAFVVDSTSARDIKENSVLHCFENIGSKLMYMYVAGEVGEADEWECTKDLLYFRRRVLRFMFTEKWFFWEHQMMLPNYCLWDVYMPYAL